MLIVIYPASSREIQCNAGWQPLRACAILAVLISNVFESHAFEPIGAIGVSLIRRNDLNPRALLVSVSRRNCGAVKFRRNNHFPCLEVSRWPRNVQRSEKATIREYGGWLKTSHSASLITMWNTARSVDEKLRDLTLFLFTWQKRKKRMHRTKILWNVVCFFAKLTLR